MNVLARLLSHFGFVRYSSSNIDLDPQLFNYLSHLAAEQQLSVPEMAHVLLHQAVTERYTAMANLQLWEELTPREKQVAALTCLGYTNAEIAAEMIISPNTVKTHMRHLLNKCAVNSKAELQQVLAGWDFQEWLNAQDFLVASERSPTNSASPDEATP